MKTRFLPIAWLLAVAGLHAQVPDTRSLDPTSVVSRTGRSGDVHRYAVDLAAEDFLELRVAQDEGAAGIVVTGPNDAPVRRINMIGLSPLDERMMFIASEAGRYGVELTLEKRATDQRYTLRVAGLRSATEHDRARDGCFALTVEGDRLAHIEHLESMGQGITLFGQASSCWRDVGDRALEAATLTSLGAVSALFSQFSKQSIAAYDRLAEIYRESGEKAQELTSVENLIREYADNGQFDRALEQSTRSHRLAGDIGSRVREARALHSIALSALLLGDYQRSHQAATAALEMATSLDDRTTYAMASYDLARLDDLAGDFDAARARYEEALRADATGQVVKSIVTLHLGLLHLRRGDYAEAEKRFQERLALGPMFIQREQEALARIGLGDVAMARGDRAGATELYTAARDALARSGNVHGCVAEERLGRVDLEDGRLDEAATRFAWMIGIGGRTGYLPCIAQARGAMADLALRRGDLDSAEREARQVIELNERFREAVPNLESRALGFGAIAPAFERAVDISMQQAACGDRAATARAFELNERALARGLLDQISEATIDRGATISTELAGERQRVREQWRARLAELQIVARSPASKARADGLLAEITSLEIRIRDLEAKANAADARRPGLLKPPPLDLARIQALLDENTQLLEYALGARQSYLWVVSAKELRAFTLAPRAAITAAAQAVHEDLASASTASLPAARERRRALARLVLEPAASALTARRLVIVVTGPLALIPFAALPIPREIESPALSGVEGPMLSRYEIAHIPSATTVAAMRTLSDRRSRPSKTAVVLADPIFERADPRVQTAQATPAATARRATTEIGRSFPRLPFSRMEARTINAILPGEVTMFTDGDATRARVLGNALADYRVVHFATHGIAHAEIASLSSIVLSMVDQKGTPQDPFVTLSDIYEMRLNADVVVLSACSTAMGKNVPGEGPIGLARAFMYAGAPRVVASLWQVNDNATAELMKRFYQGMLIDRLTPAAALRRAQQQLAAIPRWASPYFWAPFVLQGDWK